MSAPAVIEDPTAADPRWLTQVLREAGALPAGEVSEVAAEHGGSSWSHHARLALRYRPRDAPGPASLFLKSCTGSQAVFGASEVHYYTRDYLGVTDVPLLRCYHAAYREEPRAYHLLLQDVSASHRDTFGTRPDRALAEAVADAVARLHAPYWGERLGASPTPLADEAALDRWFAHTGYGLAPMLEILGDELPSGARRTLERVFGEHRGVLERRLRDPEGATLVHGDLNPGNLLVPRAGLASAPLYLIDRQPFDWSLEGWLGASDLAIWLVLHGDADCRRELEQPLLRRYAEALDARGIACDRGRLWDDYRLSVAQCLEMAVEWCVLPADRSEKRWLWQRQLENGIRAFDELGCAELFGGS